MAEETLDRQTSLLWLLAALGLVLLAPLAPLLVGGLWSCPFKTLTGIPCPLCGTTRAALALGRLDVAEAFLRYPLPALAWTLFLAGGVAAGWLAWRRQPLPKVRLPAWAWWTILAAVAANWAYGIATGV